MPGFGQQKRPTPCLKPIPKHLDDETTNIYIKATESGGKIKGRCQVVWGRGSHTNAVWATLAAQTLIIIITSNFCVTSVPRAQMKFGGVALLLAN